MRQGQSPRAPQKLADVLSELMARRGFARVRGHEEYARAWQQAAGEAIAAHTSLGLVRGGTWEVKVANSALVQELTYRKQGILAELARLLPQANIANLRFRVGTIE